MSGFDQNNVDLTHFYDVVIIGAGPAGLTAALNLARACYRVAVIEKNKPGGLISLVSEIVNFPGLPSISGAALLKQMREHAAHFGAEFLDAEVTAIKDAAANIKTLETTRGTLHTYGILLATGARPKKLGFKGEDLYRGRGIAFNAAVDGEFFTGKEIIVVGTGITAAEESVFLTKYASHVTVLVSGPEYTCDAVFWERAEAHPSVTIHKNSKILQVDGDSLLRSITWQTLNNGETHTFSPDTGDTFGIFMCTGYEPATALVRDFIELDELYYVLVDRKQRTSLAGIYAAGDVCSFALRQSLTAAASGAVAASDLAHFVFRMQTKVGIVPEYAAHRASLHKTVDAKPGDMDTEKKSLFSPDMLGQLNTVFMMMERPLVLHLYPDSSKVSDELTSYMHSLAGLAPQLRVQSEEPSDKEPDVRPCVRVTYEDGTETGICFHGMPGGNEFNSFVLGLYNASCDGQKVDDAAREKITSITKDLHIEIFVTLTCAMCPELVTSAQRIATLSEHITTDVYDLNHYPALRESLNIMSVPCFRINGGRLLFGHKTVNQLLEYL